MNPPLRLVLLAPILVTIIAGFVAFGIYVDHGEGARRLAEIDGELARAARTDVDPVAARPGDAPPPTGSDALDVAAPVDLRLSPGGQVVGRQGAANPFSPGELVALAATDGVTTLEVQDHRVRVAPQADGQVVVTALPLAGYRSAMDALLRSLVAGGLVLAVVEAVIVWLLASRLIRPLGAMSSAARRVADGELDSPVDRGGGSREVADLSRDIGRMVQRLRSALEAGEASADEATRARDDMRRFLADVSHEIRTPLTALQGYSDLYAGGMLTETGSVDRAMSRVGSESRRLHTLVTAMMALSRGGPTAAGAPVDVDVAGIATAVVDDLRAAFPHRRIGFEVGDGADSRVLADPARIHQALLNLGANACTHTEADGPVTITVTPTPGALEVSVVDHGAGIDETERERVFLPFYRSDPSRARNGHGGAGLGLAVTRQIADEHGGSVAVHATPGGGATVTLRLPTHAG